MAYFDRIDDYASLAFWTEPKEPNQISKSASVRIGTTLTVSGILHTLVYILLEFSGHAFRRTWD